MQESGMCIQKRSQHLLGGYEKHHKSTVYCNMDSLKYTGEQEIKKLQKTAISNAALILREVLMLKYKILKMGNNITWAKNRKYTIAAKLCTLDTWFVLGIKL